MRQPSFKIVLPQELRDALEKDAERQGLSLAELIRRWLAMMTSDPMDAAFLSAVGALCNLVQVSTGYRFEEHPAAGEMLRVAIGQVLERAGARVGAKFTEEELDRAGGERLVPGTDPVVMGAAIEAMAVAQNTGGDDGGTPGGPRRRLRRSDRE